MGRAARFAWIALVACAKKDLRVTADGGGVVEATAPAASLSFHEEMWVDARDGEPEALMRLATREGSLKLRARAEEAAYRKTALSALAFVDDFLAFPFLAEVADGREDEEALLALSAIHALASSKRHSRAQDDEGEIRTGCRTLLEFAKNRGKKEAGRALAISSLRMLKDRGCAREEEIPDDLDAR